MEENNEVRGANDPTISSREKDRLFADEPRRPEDRAEGDVRASDTKDLTTKREAALAAHRAQVTDNDVVVEEVPERHVPGGPYDEEAADTTPEDADYDAPETNKKDETA